METNVKIVGFANESFNGKSISSNGFDINYDGNVADVNAFSNGKVYYMRLGNEDIQKLLSIQPSSRSLEENLISDYNVNPRTIKYNIIRRNKQRPSTRKKIKRRKHSNKVRFTSSHKSRTHSRGKTRRTRSQRTLTPYYKPKYNPVRVPIPSIERTIY